MIPVPPADEPSSFDARVRVPGLAALAELVGEPTSFKRPGPKRKARYVRREDIDWKAHGLSFWTKAIPELRTRYDSRCAYLAVELPLAVGWATVDHFVPKSADWRCAYEWRNYRLCAGLVNGAKSEQALPLDPFTLKPGLFALEFASYQVVVGPKADKRARLDVLDTIDILKLNAVACRGLRQAYVEDYRLGPPVGVALQNLERRAPFIASELRRQGLLVRGDR